MKKLLKKICHPLPGLLISILVCVRFQLNLQFDGPAILKLLRME